MQILAQEYVGHLLLAELSATSPHVLVTQGTQEIHSDSAQELQHVSLHYLIKQVL